MTRRPTIIVLLAFVVLSACGDEERLTKATTTIKVDAPIASVDTENKDTGDTLPVSEALPAVVDTMPLSERLPTDELPLSTTAGTELHCLAVCTTDAPPGTDTAPLPPTESGQCPVASHRADAVAGCGDVGSLVTYVQQLLQCVGFTNVAADGEFGPNTYAAVAQFQTNVGLTADGLAGPTTQTNLETSCANDD